MHSSGLVFITLFFYYYEKFKTHTEVETSIITKSDYHNPFSTISNTWPILYAHPGRIS